MIFRCVTAEQYDWLLSYVAQVGATYDTMTRGNSLFFGLSEYHWRKLEYSGVLFSAAVQ